MKKIYMLILLMLTIIILAACDEDDRSFVIDEVTIDTVIQEDGTMAVSELYTYSFGGSFNGLTRSIHSDEKNFSAYAVDSEEMHLPMETDKLEELKVEFDDDEDMYKIYQAATNETKSVLYTYDVDHSVKKYADIGKLEYQFFDKSNETPIHNLSIQITAEKDLSSDDIYAFLREDGNGKVSVKDQALRYENDYLPAKKDSFITYLFPAEALPSMALTKDRDELDKSLAAQADWEKRGEQLASKMKQLQPFLYAMIAIIIIITIIVWRLHPNRTRQYMDEESLRQLLEETDPLFIDYLDRFLLTDNDSIIPALFSLKMRGVVRIEEVASERYPDKQTIRFIWLQSNSSVDEADLFLRDWLFTEETNGKQSFLLDSVMDDTDESDATRQEKGKTFERQLNDWKGLVQERPEYEHVRNRYPMYTWLSVLFILIAASIFYYFISIDQITETVQFGLQVVLIATTIITLLCARFKFVTFFYYVLLIVLHFIFFTNGATTTVAGVLMGVILIASLTISAYYWTDEVGQIKKAMNLAYHEMFTQEYPLGKTVDTIENLLLFAIVLNVGKNFAKQLNKEEFVQQFSESNLLSAPLHFATSTNLTSMTFYSTSSGASTSTSSSSSSTGGGGAGAF